MQTTFPDVDAEQAEDILDLYDRYEDRADTSRVDLSTLEGTIAAVQDTEFYDRAVDAIEYLWDMGARPIGIGTTRVTFRVDEYMVAKVPIEGRGVYCCVRESDLSASSGKTGYIPIADCDLDSDMLILWMESVTPHIGDYKTLPDWTWSIDGFQAGYDRDGVLVAYDL